MPRPPQNEDGKESNATSSLSANKDSAESNAMSSSSAELISHDVRLYISIDTSAGLSNKFFTELTATSAHESR